MGKGTSNVGIFGGKDGKPAGDATNVVTDYAWMRGEARSPELTFAAEIAEAFGAGLRGGEAGRARQPTAPWQK